jgi:hypothetical protein
VAIPYAAFFRSYGVRKVGELPQPRFAKLVNIQLPRDSIYVYLPSGVEDGPALDDLYLKAITRPVMMQHVTDLTSKKGNLRPAIFQAAAVIRKYHSRCRKYRLAKDIVEASKDPSVPGVLNMSLMQRPYKYVRNIYTEYNRWYNGFHTTLTTMAQIAARTDRNIFMEVQLPKQLPSISLLKMIETSQEDVMDDNEKKALGFLNMQSFAQEHGEDVAVFLRRDLGIPAGEINVSLEAINSSTIQKMSEPGSFFVSELWKWLGLKRDNSLFTLLTGNYNKINFIFRSGQFWTVINLGVIDSWRKAPPGEKIVIPIWNDVGDKVEEKEPTYVVPNEQGISPKNTQLLMIKFFMRVYELGTLSSRHSEDAIAEKIEQQASADNEKKSDGDEVEANPPIEEVEQKLDDITLPPDDRQIDAAELETSEEKEPIDPLFDTGFDAQKYALDEKELEKQLNSLAEITSAISAIDTSQAADARTTKVYNPETGLMAICDRLAEDGAISAVEYKNYQKLSTAYKSIKVKDHTGADVTLDKFIDIKPEELAIKSEPIMKDRPTVVDKSMLYSVYQQMDRDYIEKVYQRDLASMAVNLQKAGVAVTGYESELVEDAAGAHHVIAIRINPVIGTPSTLRMRVPALEEDGTFRSNNVKYCLRKQRGDDPVRKISPSEVALTSYYGKLFVERSSRAASNYNTWLTNAIMAAGLDATNGIVTSIEPLNVFNNRFKCPRPFSAMAKVFKTATIAGWSFSFESNPKVREQLYGKDFLEKYEKDGMIAVATNRNMDIGEGKILSRVARVMLMDPVGGLYSVENGKLVPQTSFEKLAGLDLYRRPIEYTEIKIAGKYIPVGVVLGFYIGYNTLVHQLGVSPRIAFPGQRLSLDEDEFALYFRDEIHIYSRDNAAVSLLLGGFAALSGATKEYSAHEFNKPGVYLNVIEATRGGTVRQIRELDMLDKLFIDPITLGLLQEQNLPQTWHGILLYASNLLVDDQHPDEVDPAYMRIKGHERIAGLAYKEMVNAVKAHNARSDKAKTPIEMTPHAVWRSITQDATVAISEETNPIQNLKEMEAVTYGGAGGRSIDTMTRETRIFHDNDLGTVSELSVDSGDIGVNVYTSANPVFINLRGKSKPLARGEKNPTSTLSTAALLSPASDKDDPRRVNFVGIQARHVVPCVGYKQAAVRTGYEQAIPHRTTNDLFSTTARQDGKVLSITDTGILVQYKDGTKKGIEIGRRYGVAAGMTLPHDVVTPLKEGQSFKAGDPLAYNKDFFEPDMLDPTQIVMKTGALVNIAFLESSATADDSSAISRKISELLTTRVTKVKQVVVEFTQQIHKCMKPGTDANIGDVYCIIEDAITSDNSLFDEASLETLKLVGSHVPTVKEKSRLERIEVFYHGDKEDMSESLRQLADYSDRQRTKRRASIGKKPMTGSVDSGFRVDGNPLQLDTACINFFMTADVPEGVGDKNVIGNQMKTVIGEVFPMEIRTERGEEIDVLFGQKSIDDRIVNSPEIIGTTTTLLEIIGKNAAKIFFGK